MRCEMVERCPFFHTMEMRAVNALKEVYCEGTPALCARLRVAQAVGRENVPLGLAPNHAHLVDDIIRAVRCGQERQKPE
jgi:hypothetical protein